MLVMAGLGFLLLFLELLLLMPVVAVVPLIQVG
jgi:hypothetical protein